MFHKKQAYLIWKGLVDVVTKKAGNWSCPGCPQAPHWQLPWEEIVERYSLLAPLAHCEQDKTFHEEGDVLKHTRLVCEALVADEEWRALPAKERSIVFAAALFHDVGKPDKTEIWADGRISSFGHARKGARLVRPMFYRGQDMDGAVPPFDCREQIYDLIRYHSIARQWIDREQAQRDVIRATMRAPGQLFRILGRADTVGRICDDINEALERVELFSEFCRDNSCFHQPRTFPSSNTRYLFLTGERPCPDVEAFDDTSFEVVLLVGLPGAGKDSWIKEQRELSTEIGGLPVISLDEIRGRMKVSPADNQGRVVDQAKEEARELLRRKEPFIWNATNVSFTLRGGLVALFRRYGARVRMVYRETPYCLLLQRNDERKEHVPVKVVEYLINKLEVPTNEEAHEVEWSLEDS